MPELQPRIMLCTLVLNEMEWLPRLIEQHRAWPGLVRWVFVEAADRVYERTNPDMVSAGGLSVDGTTRFLGNLADCPGLVTYIPHGHCGDIHRPALGKCEARQRYLEVADRVKPDWLVILDADEFYCHEHQAMATEAAARAEERWSALCFKYRHPWCPPPLQGKQPLLKDEVVGGFWDIPHCHVWRWEPGLRYRSHHMTPERQDGTMLSSRMLHLRRSSDPTPHCVHMAFASRLKGRHAKHCYYAERGEANDPKRRWYVRSRGAWETWQPGYGLPHGARVVPYTGPIPEVLRNEAVETEP